jgi:hypothetical protein
LGTSEISDLGTEVRVVEDIEKLSPEAKLHSFCQMKLTLKCEVQL